MTRTRIKICGITEPEHAVQAVAAGADAIGLVFYSKSPRAVSADQAAEIVAAIGPFVTVTGLFVNAQGAEVDDVLSRVPLSLLQFHGDEAPEYCASFDRPWIKALRVKNSDDITRGAAAYAHANGLLLDTYAEGVPGGTGQTFDWNVIPNALRSRIVLAGGLNPNNVGEAVRRIHPWAVDVSGGVESSPGVKDPNLVTQFIDAVKAEDV